MPTEKLRNVFSRARNSPIRCTRYSHRRGICSDSRRSPGRHTPHNCAGYTETYRARHRIVVTRLIVEKHGRYLVVAARTERTRIIDFGFDIPVPITPIIVFRIIQRLIFAIIGCSLRGRNVNDGLIVIRISLWFGRIFKIRFIISPLIFLPPSIGSTAFR